MRYFTLILPFALALATGCSSSDSKSNAGSSGSSGASGSAGSGGSSGSGGSAGSSGGGQGGQAGQAGQAGSSGASGSAGSSGAAAITCEGIDTSETEDPATFTADGTMAIMRGEIGTNTPAVLSDFLQKHPEVKVIAMGYVPGSGDDVANLQASRMIRKAGLATCVPSKGLVASGGTDFFISGKTRHAADGAKVGVHSWATGDGQEGKDFRMDDPEHKKYLDYYDEMGIPQDFYWFTLKAAPAAGMHYMTRPEMVQYKLVEASE